MYFNVPAHEVLHVASAIRRERYGMTMADGASGLEMMSKIGDVARQLDFTWIGLPPDSPLNGRTLGELQIRVGERRLVDGEADGVERAGQTPIRKRLPGCHSDRNDEWNEGREQRRRGHGIAASS